MTIQMNSNSSQLKKESLQVSNESVQRLYNKVVELEKRIKNAVQAKTPSDPSIWSQLRENYEAIILEDHDFSESHEIEHALWNLHYKKIEEFRNRMRNAAMLTNDGNHPQGNKIIVKRDQAKKIRAVFKSFLVEATGFYHELILKIKSRYGLPVDYFPNQGEEYFTSDIVKSSNIKKAVVSCHRCFIYLGDLARYKELYGEGQREFSVASNYYIQATLLWPLSGNPHHQLAILATYTGDELVAVYRYFRSLAVESPFLTARDNLILIFDKNRQSYSQLPQETDSSVVKQPFTKGAGRTGQRTVPKLPGKEHKQGTVIMRKTPVNLVEVNKTFRIRFVRLNGILFTRTSLEIFDDVCASALDDLDELLSLESDLEINEAESFTNNSVLGGLVVLQLVSIIIFTVHNIIEAVKKNMSMSEILQRTVLHQNVFTATFEFVGRIIRKCGAAEDISSCSFLPATMIFLEWLSCRLDFLTTNQDEDQQTAARTAFWTHCLVLFNKLQDIDKVEHNLEGNSMGGREFMFSGNKCHGEEIRDCSALWEDFELRGFLPLAPVQLSLDFSKRCFYKGLGGKRERTIRLKRILAAGKVIATSLDATSCRIYLGPERKNETKAETAKGSSDSVVRLENDSKELQQEPVTPKLPSEQTVVPASGDGIYKAALIKEEEEDEVIVFKPMQQNTTTMNIGKVGMTSLSEKSSESPSSVPYSAFPAPLRISSPISIQNAAPSSISQEIQRPFPGSPAPRESSLQIASYSTMLQAARDHSFPSSSTSEVTSYFRNSFGSTDPWSTGIGSPNTSFTRPLDCWNAQSHNEGIKKDNLGVSGNIELGCQPSKHMDSALYIEPERYLMNGMTKLNLGRQFQTKDLRSTPVPLSISTAFPDPAPAQSNWSMSQSFYAWTPSLSFPLDTANSCASDKLFFVSASSDKPVFSFELSTSRRHSTRANVNVEFPQKPLTASTTLSITAAASVPTLSLKKGTTSRPRRHFGPPPGFGPVPSKSLHNSKIDSLTQAGTTSQKEDTSVKMAEVQEDDYSWLDGYMPPKKLADAQTSTAKNFLVPRKSNTSLQSQHEHQHLEAKQHAEFKTLQCVQHQKQMQLPGQLQLPSLWSGYHYS